MSTDTPVLGAELVAKLTGPDSINETDTRYNVYGTDLGHSFEHRGRTCFVFGDTYGPKRTHRRSNLLAWSASLELPDAARFEGMVTDARGRARDLLPRHLWRREVTRIPTYGVSIEGRMYLHYMSVRRWGRPGEWTLSGAGLAYSDDDGLSWTQPREARWQPGSPFGQVAFVHLQGYLYLFGIPGGRFGLLKLARVPEQSVLDFRCYEYWTGHYWEQKAVGRAAAILPPPVGELSVRWSKHLRKWVMMYLDERRGAIVLRTAEHLVGPWSKPEVVTTSKEYPQLYAPYMLPHAESEGGLYFTMSLFRPYNVYLMRTSLDQLAESFGQMPGEL